MLTEPTKDKLYAMRLIAMAAAWQEQQSDGKMNALGFDERFGMLVDAEYLARDNRRLKRLLKDAQLRLPEACLEDVEVSAARGLERGLVAQLATCAWVGEHHNVIISGLTGVGKSYLACASGRSHVEEASALSTVGCPVSSRSSVWRRPTDPTRGSSASWRASTS